MDKLNKKINKKCIYNVELPKSMPTSITLILFDAQLIYINILNILLLKCYQSR